MQAAQQNSSNNIHDAGQEPPPQLALGPPHDTWGTLTATLGLALHFFFFGRMQVEDDWIGWIGVIVSLAVLFAGAYYFRRAYGFTSSWGRSREGRVAQGFGAMALIGMVLALTMVSPAVYAHFSDEGMLRIVLSSLAVAMAIVGALRFGLGSARPGAD